MSRIKSAAGPRFVGLLIVLFFLVDRAMGTGFLLPEFCVEDERWLEEGSVKMVREMSLNPGTHKYPQLAFFLTAGVYAAAYLAADVKALPHLESWSSFRHHLAEYPFGFEAAILLGRLLVAGLGAAALWLFYLLARRVFNEFVSLTALFLLATSPAFLFSTQLLKNDVLVVMGVVMVLLAALRILERGGVKDYLAAGLAAGFCLAAKYHVIALVPVLAAHRLRHREEGFWRAFFRLRWLWVFPAAGAFFFMLSPWTFLDFSGTLRQAWLELAIQNRLDPLLRRSPGLWWHQPILFQFSAVLPLALGIPLYLLSLIGLFWKTEFTAPEKLVLWSYPAGFLAFMIAFSELGVPHLYVSAAPFFALSAAAPLGAGLAAPVRWKRGLSAALLGVVAGYNLFLFHSFAGAEEWVTGEALGRLETSHRPGQRDLALLPYFANPDRNFHASFAPQFLLSSKLLSESAADRILLHHTFYQAYLDNKELAEDPRVAEMLLTFLSLRAGKSGYKEKECWTATLPTASWYQALWPDLAGLKACIYERPPAEPTPAESGRVVPPL